MVYTNNNNNNNWRIDKKDTPKVSLGIKNGVVTASIYKNNRSFGQMKRWALARQKKEIWENYNPNSKYNLNEFGKKDNILDKNVTIFDISVQVDYSSSGGGLSITPQTYQVIGFNGLETNNSLKNKVQLSYENMLYSETNDTFNPKFQNAISENMKIDINEIRGGELNTTTKPNLNNNDYVELIKGKFIIKNNNNYISANKQKLKGNKGKSFKVKIDLEKYL